MVEVDNRRLGAAVLEGAASGIAKVTIAGEEDEDTAELLSALTKAVSGATFTSHFTSVYDPSST